MPIHLPLPGEIRALRRKLGLTQAEVARDAGVSQPLVARIESGAVDPRLSSLRAVVDALNRAEGRGVVLRDVMTSPVASVRVTDTVSAVIRVMREKGISQVPVLSKGNAVGSVSDRGIVHALSEAQDADALARMPVSRIMAPPFPAAEPDTTVEQAYRTLEDQPAMLVVERGKVIGIVSQADLLGLVR